MSRETKMVTVKLEDLGYTWEEYVEAQEDDIETLISDIDEYLEEQFGCEVSWGIYNDNEEEETIELEVKITK